MVEDSLMARRDAALTVLTDLRIDAYLLPDDLWVYVWTVMIDARERGEG